MMVWRAALEQVLFLRNNPQALDAMREAPLPDGMASLMRLASDAGSLLEEVARSHDMLASQLQAYVAEYLMAVCLYPHSSPWRVLGLNDAKNMALAKEHHRLLLKWLHPDRNPHHKQHAERVNQAWTALKNQNSDVELVTKVAEFSTDRYEHLPLPKTRFPLFLVAAFSLAGLLLAFSFWPDDAVYVYGSKSAAQQDANSEFGQDKNDLELSWLARLKNPSVPESKPSAATAPVVSSDVTSHKLVQKEKPVAKQALLAEQNKPPIVAKPVIESSAVLDIPNTEISAPVASIAERKVEQKSVPHENNSEQNALSNTEQAQHLLAQFSQSYQQGNLTQFMALFSTQARNNRGDRLAIEQDYRELFSHSTRRSIRFSDLQWQPLATQTLQAQYHTQVKWQNKWTQVAHHGRIEFMFIHENGKLRIQQILLGD